MARSDRGVRKPNGGDVLLPVPSTGRVFRAGRRVRLGDVDPEGRLRLDALARYLQDVASDDTEDSGLPDAQAWVVRRTVVEQRRAAVLGERLELATFCSGWGSRWAERRVSVLGEGGAVVDAVTVWVHVDPATGRPRHLSPEFHALYDAAAAGREVVARQVVEAVDRDDPRARSFGWHPRATDFDVLDHVNNSVAWALVEQVRMRSLADPEGSTDPFARPFRAELDFHDALGRASALAEAAFTVVHVADDDGLRLSLWGDDGVLHVAARLQPLGDSTRP